MWPRPGHADKSNTLWKGRDKDRRNPGCWIIPGKKAAYPFRTPLYHWWLMREISLQFGEPLCIWAFSTAWSVTACMTWGIFLGLTLWKSLSRVWLFVTPWTIQSMNSPGQNTGVGSCSLLQGIFPTQGSNPGLLHCRWILHQLSHQGSPRILEWVAYPFSRGCSWSGINPGSLALQTDSFFLRICLPVLMWIRFLVQADFLPAEHFTGSQSWLEWYEWY